MVLSVLPSDVLQRTVGKKVFHVHFAHKLYLYDIYYPNKRSVAGLMVQFAQSICILSHKFHIKQNADKEKHSISTLP